MCCAVTITHYVLKLSYLLITCLLELIAKLNQRK